jgi:predicted nucleotidyltransferase
MTITLIDDHRAQIADLCRSFGVRQLDVFGSAVRDDFDPAHSDVDFLVDFAQDEDRNRFRDYFALREALASLLGRPVDLVMARALTNRYLEAAIDAERQLVYAA